MNRRIRPTGRSRARNRSRVSFTLAAAALLLGPFAALTAVVVVTQPGVFGFDSDVATWLHRPVLAHPHLGSALRVIGLITEPNWLRLITVLAAVRLWRSDLRRAAAWLVTTMAIGGVLGGVLKEVFARSRPEWPEAITVLTGYSFPSGHALNSMLAAGCTIVLVAPRLGPVGRRRLWVACGAFVLLVGFDRVALGVHYLSDVLAGWSLALAVLFATLAAFTPFAVRPDSAPGQSGDGPTSASSRTRPTGSPPVPTDARPPPVAE
jgi:membrane-associated phospholipid phosphatase